MKTESSTNPFAILLAGLSTTEPTPVTLGFLEWVTEVVNKPSVVVQTYGEAFQVLQFLETARVVELLEIPEKDAFTIRKL